MEMRKMIKRLTAVLLLIMTLVFGAAGCATTTLDNTVPASTAEDATAQNSDGAENEAEDTPETESEDEYFDLESAGDDEIDYSKYDEKTSSSGGSSSGSGNPYVTYSDGSRTEKDEYQTDPVPEGRPNPVEPEDVTIDKNVKNTCYMTISCSTILDNMDMLTPGKESLVPKDGIIYARRAVTFYEGESVFDVLLRETQNNRIHMEYSFTPAFNSNYIEGINNLYEFDCGDLSGWMYCVNGWYPNYGCSRYIVQAGDEIQWNYTCDLGRDVGRE